jgi:hypoxanthine phosphoribosyltransferase
MAEIQEIVLDEETIARKVDELAGLISKDYAEKELVLVCILKGAVMFATDLSRRVSCPVILEFIQASSYGTSATSSGNVLVQKDLETDVQGRHVLLVDTIVDTGKTMDRLFKLLSERKPASLNAAILLDKSCKRLVDVPIAYRGFEIPDEFVVGYGLDYGGRFRNLPSIAVLKADR